MRTFIQMSPGCPLSPALGSVRKAHAMIKSATTDSAPTTLIHGTPATRPFTGEDSKTSGSRYGNTMAAIDTRMKPRMKPKMPTSVAKSGTYTNAARATIEPAPTSMRAFTGV
jgi:hypothetical protein